jgi:hypothetical protein
MEYAAVRILGDWWELATCQAAAPDLFLPISAGGGAENEVPRVQVVTQRYQIRAKCRIDTLATRQMPGIWGGLTEIKRLPLFAPAPAR